MSHLSHIVQQMKKQGAQRVLIKPLANNDNSKNQIYFGANFEVIQAIPSGDIYADGMSARGAIFKAPLMLYWMDYSGNTEQAKHAQIILYPDYPEIRMSGFLFGTDRKANIAPSHLMQPPTKAEREQRENKHRYLILGVNNKAIWAFCTSWDDEIQQEVKLFTESEHASLVASVFFEYKAWTQTSEEKLLARLTEIYQTGAIQSCRLNRHGELIDYRAKNGAGYTLEAQFGIRPNGSPDPDFIDWEIKSHSKGSAITLMTPEPNVGSYLDDLESFLRSYGTNIQADRLNFSSRHLVEQTNPKTNLTLRLEGYNPETGKITDPEGGLILRDQTGNLAAGWRFEKFIQHWKNKHSNTCYVSYTKSSDEPITYQYGPKVTLGKGTDFSKLLKALHLSVVYYDPGTNMKLKEGRWIPKKRNQFRVAWKNIGALYHELVEVDLSQL